MRIKRQADYLRALWALAAVLPGSLVFAGAGAVCNGVDRNIGEVWSNEVISEKVEISNSGDSALEVGRGPAGSNDARVRIKPSRLIIEPGKKAVVTVGLDTSGLSGNVDCSASLTTNDSSKPAIPIRFKGVVKPVVEVTPVRVEFFQVLRGTRGECVVDIKSADGAAFEVLGVKVKDSEMTGTVERADGQRGERKVRFVFAPKSEKRFVGDIDIETNHPRFPRITLKCLAEAVGEVDYHPKTIEAVLDKNTNPGGGPIVVITSQVKDGSELKVAGIKSDLPGVSFPVIREGKSFKWFKVEGLDMNKACEGKIEVSIKSPKVQQIVIPVRIIDAGRPADTK